MSEVRDNFGKPEGAKAGWKVLGTEYPFDDPHLKLRQDCIALPDGEEMTFTYQEHPAGVVIVPVTTDGRIVMIRQYRYAVDAWCLEVPAGGTHDTGNAGLDEVARKELHEEIGASCETLEYVGWFFSSPAATDETCHVFLARGVRLQERPETEASESIEIRPTSITEALRLARTGQVAVGPSALALLMCEDRLAAPKGIEPNE